MSDKLTVATAPKTATFQMRINPEIKAMLEDYYAQCGMTLTDAINVFFQQSLNAQGFPFLANDTLIDYLKQQAFDQLMIEIKKADDSIGSLDDLIDEDEVKRKFGIKL